MYRTYFSKSLKFALLATLLVTTGCAEYHRRELESMPNRGPQFNCSLAKEYENIGRMEQVDMFDEWSANHYFCKAILAKKGCCVLPTSPCEVSTPKEKLPELLTARQRLMRALCAGARKKAPRLTAHAQAFYDYWVEQQEEEWQHRDIAVCRHTFYKTIAEIELILMGGFHDVLPDYSVLFAINSDHLSLQSLAVIDKIAQAAKGRHILLLGHTDRVGETQHNKNLAKRRALAVQKEFLRRGFPSCFVTVKSGIIMSGPKVDANDRRVDIIVLK